jgi:hypothetical protein
MGKVLVLTGQRFGRLVAVKRRFKRGERRAKWECVCDCGGVSLVRASDLRSGNTQSCGCKVREGTHWTHGCKGTPEYVAWKHMKSRCYNEADKSYDRYGGRGIMVCWRWRRSFESFLADMGRKPSRKHTLERVDVNGNYERRNCRWATMVEQARNKTNNHLITHAGRTKTLSEWAEEGAVSPQLFRTRLLRYGWPFERALYEPPAKKNPAPCEGGVDVRQRE